MSASALLAPLLDLFYPPRCAVCRTLGEPGPMCRACLAAVTPVPEPLCDHSTAEVCWCGLGAYEGVLRESIHRFKYGDRPGLAEPLGVLLAAFARAQSASLNGLRFDALVPVPMHRVRQRLRGYNQSERLARVVARELGFPLRSDWLIRPRPTRPQVGLNAEARRSNLVGAFVVPQPSAVDGKTILLIDDVRTTGSTLQESAAPLHAAGAKAVYALTLAAG